MILLHPLPYPHSEVPVFYSLMFSLLYMFYPSYSCTPLATYSILTFCPSTAWFRKVSLAYVLLWGGVLPIYYNLIFHIPILGLSCGAGPLRITGRKFMWPPSLAWWTGVHGSLLLLLLKLGGALSLFGSLIGSILRSVGAFWV